MTATIITSLRAANALEDHAGRGRAHAVGIRLGERGEGLLCRVAIGVLGLSVGREPRRPGEIDGADEGGFLGVVGVQGSRGSASARSTEAPIDAHSSQIRELGRYGRVISIS